MVWLVGRALGGASSDSWRLSGYHLLGRGGLWLPCRLLAERLLVEGRLLLLGRPHLGGRLELALRRLRLELGRLGLELSLLGLELSLLRLELLLLGLELSLLLLELLLLRALLLRRPPELVGSLGRPLGSSAEEPVKAVGDAAEEPLAVDSGEEGKEEEDKIGLHLGCDV